MEARQTLVSTLPTRQTWIGAQSTGADWAIYTGTSYALTGDIMSDGWRMRVTGGFGRYHYHSAGSRFRGRSGTGTLLLGHRLQMGDLTLKAFAGLAGAGHVVVPFDPDNAAIGTNYGGAGTLEAWLNYSERVWFSGDASYATVAESFSANLRIGRRALHGSSLGAEIGITGNADFAAVRLAGLIRHPWTNGEIVVSVGGSKDRDSPAKPYAAVVVSLKY